MSLQGEVNEWAWLDALEQVGDLDGGVDGASDARAVAPPAVQPVHAADRAPVPRDADHLGQSALHTHLAERTWQRERECVCT